MVINSCNPDPHVWGRGSLFHFSQQVLQLTANMRVLFSQPARQRNRENEYGKKMNVSVE